MPNMDIDLPAVLSAFAFQDEAGVMGQLAYDLGNAYQKPEVMVHNGSILFWVYSMPLEGFPQNRPPNWVLGNGQAILQDHPQFAANLHQTMDYIDQVMAKLSDTRMTVTDADIVKHEFSTAARMLKHGAKRALLQLNDRVDKRVLLDDFDAMATEYQQNWLARNRPGGLIDSVARLRRARELYTA
jgi:hypothetical protein